MQDLTNQFRPSNFAEVIGLNHSRIGEATDKEILQELAMTGRVRILMFIGPSGTGKTSVARVFAAEYLGCTTLELETHSDFKQFNASGERGIDVIRYDVLNFCKIGTGNNKCRVVVFDEADGLTYQAQEALKAITEEWVKNVIFIFSLNKIKRMDLALVSRSAVFKFDPLPKDICVDWLIGKAEECNIIMNDNIAEQVIASFKGDLRKVVNSFLNLYTGHTVKKWKPTITYSEQIFNAKNPAEKYLELASKVYIDPDELLVELLLLNKLKEPIKFGQAALMLGAGRDPMIPILHALTGLVKKSK